MKSIIILLTILFFVPPTQAQKRSKPDIFGSVNARQIGPAAMSGRVSALDAVCDDPNIIYVGAACGGVWKSTNGGTTFKPVFDEQIQSIGSITVDQKRPDTIWVGTGEPWVRNSVSIGNGIYKSTDGGDKWTHTGLAKAERIGKIIIDERNPDIVYAAVLGSLWSSSQDRGLYKTSDGGKTWQRILFVNESTGCSDIAMDPQNPDLIIAGMWEFRRTPYSFNSGGEGSGVFISKDAGSTWQRLNIAGENNYLGRISVAFSGADDNLVYSLIESDNTSLYLSADKGENWELKTDSPLVGERPFYFSLIVPDPVDTNRVYKPGLTLYVSEDRGKTFKLPFVEGGNVHSDIHAIWINPRDNKQIYLGTDGGFYMTYDKGSTWKFAGNLPLSQFYHVDADRGVPYKIYGGLQDNGSWMGPSVSPGGISNADWVGIGFGDGFNVLPDNWNPDIVYWQWQGGNTVRYYKSTGESKEIKPYSNDANVDLRFNWNTPIIKSKTMEGVIYIGSQYLFKSTDRGDTWQKISPDLTSNDPEKLNQENSGGLTRDNSTAENHCTIYAISESMPDPDILWVGTDDGRLHVTKNGGEEWKDLTGSIPLLPKPYWISSIAASNYDEGTAYITADGHREGDMNTYLFKTTDFGNTWHSIAADDLEGYAHKILEDTHNRDLLFLGTEFGLYISINGGSDWYRFEGNLPRVSVRDMVIQDDRSDLVIGTHGRGVYIIDDLTPIRQLTEELLEREVVMLDSRTFEISNPKFEAGINGDDQFTGSNPAEAAFISYYLQKRHIFGDMYIEIFDETGQKIKTLPAKKNRGLNRIPWYVRKKPPKIKASSPLLLFRTLFGPTYPAGTYTVKLVKGEQTFESKLSLAYDPQLGHSKEDRDLQYSTLSRSYDLLEEISFLVYQLTEVRSKLIDAKNLVTDEAVIKRAGDLTDKLSEMEENLVVTSKIRFNASERLREKAGSLYGALISYQGKPTNSQLEAIDHFENQYMRFRQDFNRLVSDDLNYINEYFAGAGHATVSVPDRGQYEAENN